MNSTCFSLIFTQNINVMKLFFFFLFNICLIYSCFGQKDWEKKLQSQLILAEDGATIDLEAGNFVLSKSISLESKKNITIRGKGMDKTILSFKGQTQGAEGLKISNAENIVLENFTIQDSKGDAIKTMHVDRIVFRKVKTEWTGKPKKENGSYGLYPVSCTNVLIDSCVAIGASDAGIYVGQSKNIVVKNCIAYHNVAGIEIENSLNAEVFHNEAYMNTGGILVFDLPDLVQKKGGYVRVYENHIHDNDLSNFAPKGNIVAKVPKGTGVLILATNHVEVHNNRIINNRSVGVGIISYLMTEIPIKDTSYYPYPTGIYVHQNHFERANVRATFEGRFGKMFWFKLKFGKKVPHILYDGIVDEKTLDKNGKVLSPFKICIQNNDNQSFANMDAANGFKHVSKDEKPFDCSLSASELWKEILYEK